MLQTAFNFVVSFFKQKKLFISINNKDIEQELYLFIFNY